MESLSVGASLLADAGEDSDEMDAPSGGTTQPGAGRLPQPYPGDGRRGRNGDEVRGAEQQPFFPMTPFPGDTPGIRLVVDSGFGTSLSSQPCMNSQTSPVVNSRPTDCLLSASISFWCLA